MEKNRYACMICCVLLFACSRAVHAMELNSLMMECTCHIQAGSSSGTGFVVGKPDPNNPKRVYYVLVTAHHVLKDSKEAQATCIFRQKQDDGNWKLCPVKVQIRDKAKELWRKHPKADVAALFIALPPRTVENQLLTNHLLDDQLLRKYAIHPGMEVMCLGYPLNQAANTEGFPILRSGRIASFPLVPTATTKTFLVDLTVFKGNSGGPVYFVQRDPVYDGTVHMGGTIGGILGIVTGERAFPEMHEGPYETTAKLTQLQLADVVHASFIKELVDSLPVPK